MLHSILLLQLVVILVTARGLGLLLRYLGQPAVVGEMAAGIVLGPIVLGALAPDLQAHLFAKESLGGLSALSQLGLVLFMFIIGAELRAPDGVRAQVKAAGLVGMLSMLLPIALGLAIAPQLYPQFAPAGVAFWPFALFIAVAMAITAFPVLARILKDRQLTQTPVGRLALGAAAIAHVVAWVVLALVIALIASHSGWLGFGRVVVGLLGIALVVFGLLRPLFAWWLARYPDHVGRGGLMLAWLLIGTFACAAVTDWLRLNAVFGAFLFGACLPRDDRLLHLLIERIEHVAVIVLMPIFFALAGLDATADAFAGAGGFAFLLIMFAAVAGKVFGGAGGARIAGYGWRDSFAVGSLMNARGLMELIVIKVGLDAGVIGRPVFTMLMGMAILTTVMTTPMLSLFAGRKTPGAADAAETATNGL